MDGITLLELEAWPIISRGEITASKLSKGMRTVRLSKGNETPVHIDSVRPLLGRLEAKGWLRITKSEPYGGGLIRHYKATVLFSEAARIRNIIDTGGRRTNLEKSKVLRMYVDGMSFMDIFKAVGVPRSTASRWVEEADVRRRKEEKEIVIKKLAAEGSFYNSASRFQVVDIDGLKHKIGDKDFVFLRDEAGDWIRSNKDIEIIKKKMRDDCFDMIDIWWDKPRFARV